MKERDIRDVLCRVSRELDATRAVRLGSLVGVALVSAVGCGGEAEGGDVTPAYMGPAPDAGDSKDAQEAGADAGNLDDGPVIKYGAPDVDVEAAADAEPDAGPLPPYMAPDSGGQPDYAAPEPDSGAMPPYGAPEPDAGTEPDAGPQPDYGAP